MGEKLTIGYNKSLMSYCDLNKKNDAWKHVAQEMNYFDVC